jgi:hypothetical protein
MRNQNLDHCAFRFENSHFLVQSQARSLRATGLRVKLEALPHGSGGNTDISDDAIDSERIHAGQIGKLDAVMKFTGVT